MPTARREPGSRCPVDAAVGTTQNAGEPRVRCSADQPARSGEAGEREDEKTRRRPSLVEQDLITQNALDNQLRTACAVPCSALRNCSRGRSQVLLQEVVDHV
jgi:hypothetical protein